MKLSGLIAAPFTPMDNQGNLWVEQIPFYAYMLKNNRLGGVFVNSASGEDLALNLRERKITAQYWIDQKTKDFKVIIHIGHQTLNDTLHLALHAEQYGADAIALMLPSNSQDMSLEQMCHWIGNVCDTVTHTPVYYCHMPCRTHITIELNTLLKAVGHDHKNLVGAQYVHNNLMDFQLCSHLDQGRYTMVFGRDDILLCALTLGTQEFMSSAYNYAIPLYHSLIRAFDEGDLKTAEALQYKAMQFIRTFLTQDGATSLASQKAIMRYIGLDCGPLRNSQNRLTPAQCNRLYHDLDTLDFLSIASNVHTSTSIDQAYHMGCH